MTAAEPILSANTDARPAPRGPSALSVGVVVWLASELMFFSGLFAGWFLLRAKSAQWPPPGAELAVGRTGAATVLLVLSSLTMHRTVGAAHANERRRAMQWLGLTAALGVVFLANQVVEYAQAPFSISSHAYGSMFFLLTGFHGLHVIGGLLFMGGVAWMVSGSGPRASGAASLEVCAYYWHFVDVVWVAVFVSVYLLR